MTNTVGYYNGNRWPIQLVISKFNVTLTLRPGEYLLDRQGRKVNDPYFDVFVANKQLHCEISTTPVPVILIPEASVQHRAPQNTSPVHAVTEWKRDNRGVRQPVMPKAVTETVQPPVQASTVESTSDSVRPYTMEEARRAGLVRKVREVPEDYGVTDTTGLPPSSIPPIKHSIDPTMLKPQAPLPKELLGGLPKDDPNRQMRVQLVQQLKTSPAPVNESSPFGNAGATALTSPTSPLQAGAPQPVVPQPVAVLPMPELPEPPVDDFAEDQLPAEEIVEGQEELPEPAPAKTAVTQTRPAPQAPSQTAARAAKPPLQAMASKSRFVCMACGQPHKFRSQLQAHAESKHPERAKAIMAPYPADTQ